MLQELRGIIGTPEKFIRGDPRNNLPPVYDLAENKGGGRLFEELLRHPVVSDPSHCNCNNDYFSIARKLLF